MKGLMGYSWFEEGQGDLLEEEVVSRMDKKGLYRKLADYFDYRDGEDNF